MRALATINLRRLGWAPVGIVAVAVALAVVVTGGDSRASDTELARAEDGRQLFSANCATCHGQAGSGTAAAPALVGVVDRLGPDQVAATIRDGRDTSPAMPAFGDQLDDEEVAGIVAYLDTLEGDERARTGPHGPGMHRGERMRDTMMRDGMMNGAWGLWGLLWLLIALVLLVLLITLVIWLVRSMSRPPQGSAAAAGVPDSSARATLDERYARGEIDRDQYLQTRRDLGDPAD